jgi:hypothetical protein
MSLEGAIAQARELADRKRTAGFDQAALDDAARLGFANGAFEDSVDDTSDVVEEFYPEQDNAENKVQKTAAFNMSLADKLKARGEIQQPGTT